MSNKNQTKKSKKSLFKKRFDLTNRKVQFFVVIGIFAILGGGYFTIKSFAASRIWTYTWDSNGIYISPVPSNICTHNVMKDDTSKSGPNVVNVACKKNYGLGTYVWIKNGGIAPTKGWYQVCANIKGKAPGLTIRAGNSSFNPNRVADALHNVDVASYTTFCSPYVLAETSNGLYGWVASDLSKGDAWYNVSSLEIRQMDTAPPATPAK